ncbi:DNA polymerase III subunit delta [Paramaledivibacter caminithermalis]|uniref:DNA polymerase III subunit delta n=1 Tax=Paramaledivibacter caminithermalis (strain DSM 15212 / CIP 107654 / DViRD3) TaxID=1121301 RepID=A0A1M6M6D8_PARC5|nr:DNA polymerase III subunit delta [Paramaledivibacter caminithermalis]SHJ79022.1 DNA polymerase III, delta subunit [Paramaledivibacter caminithermalis DSM 15212]
MGYKSLLKDIEEENIAKIYLFYGSEKYLIKKSIAAIKDRFINNANDESFNFSYFDGLHDDVDVILNSCETLPFMGEKRIVYVKAKEAFGSSKCILSKDNEEKLIKYLPRIPDTTCLVFEGGEKIDKRKKIVKEIQANGKVIELNKLNRLTLSKWIQKILNKNNKKITVKSLESLIDSLGYLEKDSNQTLYDVENEIKKLCNYTADKSNIETCDIDKIMSKPLENNIFLLVDAVADRDGNLALNVFNQMLIGGEPEGRILHMIIRQFKILYKVKLMVDRGYTATAIAPKISLPQYIAKKYVKQANFFTDKELLDILNRSLEADRKTKTGKMPPKLAIEMLITMCCS